MGVFKKKDGAVTIFLSIIVSVCLVFSMVIVEAARARGATMQVESAMDMAAISTLTNYSEVLKQMYGLIALAEDDPEKLKDELEYYLVRTLNVKGLEEPQKGLENIVTLLDGNFDTKKPRYNSIYDFELEDLKVKPIYNLSETKIMRHQILEYMKYRAPKRLIDGTLEKFTAFGSLSKQTDDLRRKLEIDEKMDEVRKKQEKASHNTFISNSFGLALNFDASYDNIFDLIIQKCKYESHLGELEKEIEKIEHSIAQEEKKNEQVESDIEEARKRIQEIEGRIVRIKNNIDKINKELEQNYEEFNKYIDWGLKALKEAVGNLNWVLKEGVQIEDSITELRSSLEGEISDLSASIKLDLEKKEKLIKTDKINKYIQELEHNKKILEKIKENIKEPKFNNVGLKDFGRIIPEYEQIKSFLKVEEVKSLISQYKGYVNMEDGNDLTNPIEFHIPTSIKSEQNNHKDPRDIVSETEKEKPTGKGNISEAFNRLSSNISSRNTDPKIYEAEKAVVEKLIRDGYFTPSTSSQIKASSQGDIPESSINFEDKQFSKNAMEYVSRMAEGLSYGILSMRDELYINEYIIGSFTNNATNGELKEEPEFNLQGYKMSDIISARKIDGELMPNVFEKAEVEYILWGNPTESENLQATYKQLLLTRFALNSLAIYSDSTKVYKANAAAWIVAGWTGNLGVIVVQNLILLSWAFAEAIIDSNEIMNKGSKDIPIFKLKGQWNLSIDGVDSQIKNTAVNMATDYATKKAEVVIDYATTEIDELASNVGYKVKKHVDIMIEREIERAFLPFEDNLLMANELMGNKIIWNDDFMIYDIMEDGATREVRGQIEQIILEARNLIQAELSNPRVIKEQYKNIEGLKKQSNDSQRNSIESQDKGVFSRLVERDFTNYEEKFHQEQAEIYFRFKEQINLSKEKIRKHIDKQLRKQQEVLVYKVKNGIQNISNDAKEEVGRFISEIGGNIIGEDRIDYASKENSNMRSTLLTADYRDYLRIFLMFVNSDDKMKRIGDLIEINIWSRGQTPEFRLYECNTYLRVEAEVSQRYLFMGSNLIPNAFRMENDNRNFNKYVLYKGY